MPKLKDNTPEEEPIVVEVAVATPQPKLLNAKQAFIHLGGNSRLNTYIEKKYKGNKSLEDWTKEFKSKELI